MKVYKLKVNQTDASGVVLNQVEKRACTAAEVALLRADHGWPKIVDVEEIGSVPNILHAKERGRLVALYGKRRVVAAFGENPYAPLPTEAPMPRAEETEIDPTTLDIEAAVIATRNLEAQVGPGEPSEAVRMASTVPAMEFEALPTATPSSHAADDDDDDNR